MPRRKKPERKEFKSLKEILDDPEVASIYEAGIYQKNKEFEESERRHIEEIEKNIYLSFFNVRMTA